MLASNKTLGTLLNIEGSGGQNVPYQGYPKINLQIPDMKHFNEEVLVLVEVNTKYGERVTIQVSSHTIDWGFRTIAGKELHGLTDTRKQTYLSTVISKNNKVQSQRQNESTLEHL